MGLISLKYNWFLIRIKKEIEGICEIVIFHDDMGLISLKYNWFLIRIKKEIEGICEIVWV